MRNETVDIFENAVKQVAINLNLAQKDHQSKKNRSYQILDNLDFTSFFTGAVGFEPTALSASTDRKDIPACLI
jgi:hypothetical protein